MTDLDIAIISAFIGFSGSAILMAVKDIYLQNKRTNKELRRKIIEKQLDCLYSPLYRFIKTGENLLGKKTISVGKPSDEKGDGRQKIFLDETIERYLYLASDDLHPLLVKIHGPGFYRIQEADAKKIIETIEKDYDSLRKEYFELGK